MGEGDVWEKEEKKGLSSPLFQKTDATEEETSCPCLTFFRLTKKNKHGSVRKEAFIPRCYNLDVRACHSFLKRHDRNSNMSALSSFNSLVRYAYIAEEKGKNEIQICSCFA